MSPLRLFSYYVGNIACDISGITRKSTAENRIGAADFLMQKIVEFSEKSNWCDELSDENSFAEADGGCKTSPFHVVIWKPNRKKKREVYEKWN